MEVTLSLIFESRDVELQMPEYNKNGLKNDLVREICLTYRLETVL